MYALVKAKQDLEFNYSLVQLIDIIKGIASSQYRIMEKKREHFGNYLSAFEDFFSLVNLFEVDHPFVKPASDVLGVIIVTSDAGFMGGLNTRVIDAALGRSKGRQVEYIVIGERGADYLRDAGLGFKFFPGISDQGRDEQIENLRNYIVEMAKGQKIGPLILSYPVPISFTAQRIEVVDILPFGKILEQAKELPQKKTITESKEESILEYLAGTWITYKLYEVFENAKLAEFSARTVHLEQSHQDLSRLNKILQFKYFRCRHELIDKSMRETFAARLLSKRVKCN